MTRKSATERLLSSAENESRLREAVASMSPKDLHIWDELLAASGEVGAWLSAALEDPSVCPEMRADIDRWFAALDAVNSWPNRRENQSNTAKNDQDFNNPLKCSAIEDKEDDQRNMELEPCPFCRGKGEGAEGTLEVIQQPKLWFKILCLLCMAEGPDAQTIEEARNRWNTRRQPQSSSTSQCEHKLSGCSANGSYYCLKCGDLFADDGSWCGSRPIFSTEVSDAIQQVLVGGNHLALLIGVYHPAYTEHPRDALEHYGSGDTYEIWCCWRSIMLLREALKSKEQSND